MDVISSLSALITVIQVSGQVVKICGGYIAEVQGARDQIVSLQNAVTDLQQIVQDLQDILREHGEGSLPTSSRLAEGISECLSDLQNLEGKLDPGKGKSLMRKVGLRALKWPLKRMEVESTIQRLERYKSSFVLSLQVDQTYASACL